MGPIFSGGAPREIDSDRRSLVDQSLPESADGSTQTEGIELNSTVHGNGVRPAGNFDDFNSPGQHNFQPKLLWLPRSYEAVELGRLQASLKRILIGEQVSRRVIRRKIAQLSRRAQGRYRNSPAVAIRHAG